MENDNQLPVHFESQRKRPWTVTAISALLLLYGAGCLCVASQYICFTILYGDSATKLIICLLGGIPLVITAIDLYILQPWARVAAMVLINLFLLPELYVPVFDGRMNSISSSGVWDKSDVQNLIVWASIAVLFNASLIFALTRKNVTQAFRRQPILAPTVD